MKNIFVTGGTGFIGLHVLEELDGAGFAVHALSRKNRESQGNIRFVQGDLFKLDALYETLSKMDYFVHIAGEKSNEANMQSANVDAMQVMLEEIVKHPSLKFIHISSAGIYGIETHPETIITEQSACYPNNTYERTKFESEKILQDFGRRFPLKYIILRPTNVFGEDDKGLKLLNLFKTLQKNRFFFLNKKAMVNYVYVRQLSHVIREVIGKNLCNNQIYNVNSPSLLMDFIAAAQKSLGIEKPARRIAPLFSWMLKIAAKTADLLPTRYQYINSGKYRELTSEKYYSTKALQEIVPLDEDKMLKSGIGNLVDHYRSRGLL